MGNDLRILAVFVLVISSIVLVKGNLQADEKQGFDAKRHAFCEMMLSHGKSAFDRGDVEKAGYYFLQAVKADPSRMAQAWFEGKGGEPGEQTAPAVPEGTFGTEGEVEIIMGDDEGC